jgi:hypothetical protein
MKTFTFLLMLASALLGHATEKPYFTYGDVHTMGGYPMIGVGGRAQKGIHAFDLSINASPLSLPASLNVFHLRSLYLVYPKQTGLYVGGGLGLLNEPETVKVSGSFESAIGYQWKSRIFLEGSAMVPLKQSEASVPVWPGVTVGYGF